MHYGRAPAMSVFQITFITIITIVFLQTHSADDQNSAVMPYTSTAPTDSNLQIPCIFKISDFGVKQNDTKQNVELNGMANLTERNCTTFLYSISMNYSGNSYYCRLETEQDGNQTESAESNKTGSPQQTKPTLKNLSNVMEGQSVNLSCSAEAPCPIQHPAISWSYIPESANITQLTGNSDKTQSVFSLMTFKASYRDHKKNISCTITYTRETANDSSVETNMTLLVMFPPKETHITISPSASVSAGTNVTLTCRTRASPSKILTITWYKRGEEGTVGQGKHLTFFVTQYNTGWYSCTAHNKHGNQSSDEIQLTEQNEFSVTVFAACVGGTTAIFLLFAFSFCTRTRKKTKKEDENSPNQDQDGTIDTIQCLTVTNQDTRISRRRVCEPEENAEEDSTEVDNNGSGSDVIYVQVQEIQKRPKAFMVQHEIIYSQLKI